jgi:hypothetical protein
MARAVRWSAVYAAAASYTHVPPRLNDVLPCVMMLAQAHESG